MSAHHGHHAVLQACELSVQRGQATVVDGVSLAARAGQWPRTEELLAQVLRACADLNRYIESL